MSLLIKRIDMPRCCALCWMFNDTDVACRSLHKMLDRDDYWEDRDADCPLVEIPTPHGRLADCDAVKECLEEVLEELVGEDKQFTLMLLDWAVSKRTVIEAEE